MWVMIRALAMGRMSISYCPFLLHYYTDPYRCELFEVPPVGFLEEPTDMSWSAMRAEIF